jgi:3'(2'), 5'-bisphosphate nucleotidase
MIEAELEILLQIAAAASVEVLRIYQTPFQVDYKGPADPVTEADRVANALICERLAEAFPDAAIVAEESAPESFANFREHERIFFVDPVDGTNEFVNRNGEFVVMIGAVEGDRATAAVVHAPTTGLVWAARIGGGAFRIEADGKRTPLSVSDVAELGQARLVASRSHRTPQVERALDALSALAVNAQGSAGLKGARVAEGSADAYVAPQYAGKSWDVCPTDVLVSAAGGRVSDARGKPLGYRGPSLSQESGLVATNGRMHDEILARLGALSA